MGKKKELVYLNGRLAGKYLTQDDTARLESIMRLAKNNGSIPQIKNSIKYIKSEFLEQVKLEGSTESVPVEEGTLSDPQTLSAAFMFFSKRCLIGDSVGLGKTVISASVINLIKRKYGEDKKFLFLTEKTYIEEIRDKLITFTGKYVEKCMGEKKNIMKYADIVGVEGKLDTVGTHSLLSSPVFHEFYLDYTKKHNKPPFDILIVDESEVLQNTATQMYTKGLKLTKGLDFVYLLNATPLSVNLSELYAQINFTDQTFLPTKYAFRQAFEVMEFNGYYSKPSGKYKNEEVFRNQVAYRYFAQTRKSVGAVMKDCVARIVEVPLSKNQKSLLSQASMPQMVYDYPNYFSRFSGVEEYSGKVDALLDLLETDFKDEETILVYTQYKECQEEIASRLMEFGHTVGILNGETDQFERETIIKDFKEARIRVLLSTVQKGMDFQGCNVCVFYSMGYSPSHMRQFEGRMTRSKDIIGKKSYILCTEGKERKRFDTVLKDRAKAVELFTESDFSVVLQLLLGDR